VEKLTQKKSKIDLSEIGFESQPNQGGSYYSESDYNIVKNRS